MSLDVALTGAYDAGWSAYEHFIDHAENPYSDDDERAAWSAGWRAAQSLLTGDRQRRFRRRMDAYYGRRR